MKPAHPGGLLLLTLIFTTTLTLGNDAHARRAYGASVSRGYSSRRGSAARHTTAVSGSRGYSASRTTTAATGVYGNTAVRRTTVVAAPGYEGYSGGAVAAAAVAGAVVGAAVASSQTTVVAPLPADYYATIPWATRSSTTAATSATTSGEFTTGQSSTAAARLT